MPVNWELGVSNPMQGVNQGLASLGQALQYRQGMDRQMAQDTAANNLRSIQTKTAQVNLDDLLAEQAAKIQAGGGDINAYHAQRQKVEKLKEVGDFLSKASKTPGGIKGAWPILTQAFPELADAKPEDFKTDNGLLTKDEYSPDGVFMGRAVYDPEKRTIHVMQPPKPDAAEMLDKRLAATAANTDKQIAAADARAERTAAAAERRAQQQGDKTDPIVVREAVKDLPKLRKDANMAAASKSRLDQMISLMDKGSAGGLKGNLLTTVAGVFDVPATSEADLFKKLASAGAGQLRSTVIGPGQVSNYEQKLLQSVSGGGSGARTAVRELLLFYKQEADRTIGNYNEAVDSAATVAPHVSKAFKKVGGAAPATGGKKPLSAY